MEEINDSVFGLLKYEDYWTKAGTINIFGKDEQVKIIIVADEEPEFEDSQREAYTEFFKQKDNLAKDSEKALFDYYKSILQEYRDRLGDDADSLLPILSNQEELSKLVKVTDIYFPETYAEEIRIVGILFNCTWTDKGLAVKFENEKVVKVGIQDIIL